MSGLLLMLVYMIRKSRQIQPDLFRVPRLGVGTVMAWGKIVEIGSRRKSDGRVPGGTLGYISARETLWPWGSPRVCAALALQSSGAPSSRTMVSCVSTNLSEVSRVTPLFTAHYFT